ncbi:MAG: hypothetical protein WAM27_07915 [Nitrososphaeraceae archaeon]
MTIEKDRFELIHFYYSGAEILLEAIIRTFRYAIENSLQYMESSKCWSPGFSQSTISTNGRCRQVTFIDRSNEDH